MPLLSFWSSHRTELLGLVERHVVLVLLAVLVAVAIGVPAGIVAARRPRLGKAALVFANIAQTIPSLALLGFLLPMPFVGGVGPRVAAVALILYGLLPIVRGTMAGLTSIDPAVLEVGTAMGMTEGQRLRLVELPLALPSIVSGIRVATVISIGTATVAAAVGAGGLGEYIFRGLSMVDSTVILAGAVPVAALALTADALLSWTERQLQPSRRRGGMMRMAVAGAALIVIGSVVSARLVAPRSTVVVGSKNFTEQVILGELIAQTLERDGVAVTRKLNLGGTFICDQALRAGDVDVYAEYSGTALTAIFRQPVGGGRDRVLATVRERYSTAGVTMLPPLGFNNTFAILVRRHDADELGLRTIGDLQRVAARWTAAFGYEFLEREDGYRGLASAYGLRFAREPKVMDLSLTYRALASGEVDVIAGDATSALITSLDLKVLDDDRAYFPPYDAVPLVRSATLLARPEIGASLQRLSGRISEDVMRTMNHAVDVERRDVAAVVREFLDRQPGDAS